MATTDLNINKWVECLKDRFDERERSFMTVHKASIALQIKDSETGVIHLHNLEYTAKSAENLTIKGD